MSETESMEFDVGPRPLRPRGKTLLIGAALIVAALVVGLIVRAATSGGSAVDTDPVLSVIPLNTAMYFSMSAHPEQQPNYQVIADAWKDSPEANQLESGLQLALTFTGVDWEEDVVPWLGDRVAIGVVDFGGFEQDTDTYRMPFAILAAHTRDRAASDAFLVKLRDQISKNSGASQGVQTTDYRGVSISYFDGASDSAPDYLAHASVNDIVVLTVGGSEQMQQVVDAALDGVTLAQDESFNAVMDRLPTATVGAFYMDLASYARSLQTIMSGTGLSASLLTQQIEMMQALGSTGGSISYEPGGIRIEMLSDFDTENNPLSYLNLNNLSLDPPSNRIYDSIPATASVAANISAQGGYWFDLFTSADYLNALTSASPYLNGEEILDKIREFEQQTGVDLKTDVFDLLDGELALTVLNKAAAPDPDLDPFSFSFPFDLALMVDASDIDRLFASVDRLIQAMVEAQAGDVTLQPLDSLPASALVNQNNDILLTYGVVDGRLVIGSNPDTLRAIDAADQSPLSADANFQAAMRVLPSERQQAGYVSLRPFWNWFASLSERYDQPCAVCNYLQGFKWASLSGSYEDVEAGLSRATFFIGVEKP